MNVKHVSVVCDCCTDTPANVGAENLFMFRAEFVFFSPVVLWLWNGNNEWADKKRNPQWALTWESAQRNAQTILWKNIHTQSVCLRMAEQETNFLFLGGFECELRVVAETVRGFGRLFYSVKCKGQKLHFISILPALGRWISIKNRITSRFDRCCRIGIPNRHGRTERKMLIFISAKNGFPSETHFGSHACTRSQARSRSDDVRRGLKLISIHDVDEDEANSRIFGIVCVVCFVSYRVTH